MSNVGPLLGDGLVRLRSSSAAAQLAECEGALLLFQSAAVSTAVFGAIKHFATEGHPVFMDIRNLAQWLDVNLVVANVASSPSVKQRMRADLRVISESPLTAGFKVGQIMPRASQANTLLVVSDIDAPPRLEMLAVTPDGRPGLVRLRIGKGYVAAADRMLTVLT